MNFRLRELSISHTAIQWFTTLHCSFVVCRFKVFKGKVQGKVNNTGAAMKKRFGAKEW